MMNTVQTVIHTLRPRPHTQILGHNIQLINLVVYRANTGSTHAMKALGPINLAV